ncbi:MAG TPA: glycerophosphodiester phosphodiesterase [Xanthobacteraceae bacterium]|nr:glycerophosphodiester phosphodiesterase [Xanthobacteraceae bacterium]
MTSDMPMIRAASLAIGLLAGSAAQAFDLQGHRGARGLAPENTLAAFATALSIGVTTLELDVGLSKDGALVVYHDRWLNPDITRGPDGAHLTARGPLIRSLTVEELKGYDVGRLKADSRYAQTFAQQRAADGERIPTLAEVFELVRRSGADRVRFNIETKLSPSAPDDTADPETFARALAEAVRASGLAARVSVQSFDWRTLKGMQRIAPELTRVCLTVQSSNFDTVQRDKPGASPFTAGLDVDDFGGSTPKLVHAAGCAVWSPSFRDLTAERLAEAKALGLKVIPWTVNEPADMERLTAMEVDGIITDYPDRLRKVMADRGMPLPPPAPAR